MFVETTKDVERAIFECAKDRHLFPWVDVNVRFGIIKYATNDKNNDKKKKKKTAAAAVAAAKK